MRSYEMILIVDPNVTKEGLEKLKENVEKEIKKNKGKVMESGMMGKKRLAYEIKNNMEGLYLSIIYEINPDAINGLKSSLKMREEILRTLVFKARRRG